MPLYNPNFNEKKEAEIFNNYIQQQRFYQLLNGVAVASFPEILPLSSSVTIYVHPAFITLIKFPASFKIEKAVSSSPLKRFSVSENVLEVQPKISFTENNAVIYYKDDTGNKRIMMIFFKLLNPFVKTSQIFYPEVAFVKTNILPPIKVLEKYREIYGFYPQRPYTTFRFNGVVYEIAKSRFGNVRIGNQSYLIKTNLIKR